MSKLICLTFSLLCLCVNPLMASSDLGLYGGLGIGASNTNSFTVGSDFINRRDNIDSAADASSIAGKAFIGFQINKYLGVEAEFVHLGSYDLTITSGLDKIVGSSDIYGGSASGTFSLPIGEYIGGFFENLGVFGKVGWSYFNFDNNLEERSVDIITDEQINSRRRSGSGDENGFTYGFGLKSIFLDNYSVRIEWNRFDLSGDATADVGEFDLFTVGIAYHY